MKRTLAAALAAATATAGITFATQARGQADGTTLKLVDHNTGFTYTDVKPKDAPKKASLGDTFYITGRLAGDRKGTSALVCTRIQKGSELCHGVAHLSDGDLLFQGRQTDTDAPQSLAVIGGTGAYADAQGTIRTTDGKKETTKISVTFGS